MYIVRDIFHLQFGHYKEVKVLLDQAKQKQLMPQAKQMRFLSDFTGRSYRLIMEEGYDSLADYETSLNSELGADEWQKWYAEFKKHINYSEREILKEVM